MIKILIFLKKFIWVIKVEVSNIFLVSKKLKNSFLYIFCKLYIIKNFIFENVNKREVHLLKVRLYILK